MPVRDFRNRESYFPRTRDVQSRDWGTADTENTVYCTDTVQLNLGPAIREEGFLLSKPFALVRMVPFREDFLHTKPTGIETDKGPEAKLPI